MYNIFALSLVGHHFYCTIACLGQTRSDSQLCMTDMICGNTFCLLTTRSLTSVVYHFIGRCIAKILQRLSVWFADDFADF